MKPTPKIKIDPSFRKEVREGLTSFPKYLSSKYIYDEKGDKLFQDIMGMESYYLTDCELEILKLHKESICEHFRGNGHGFDLIELGAGDGRKTKILLRHLSENQFNFIYKPIDISQNALDQLSKSLRKQLPGVQVDPEKGEYFQVLDRLRQFDKRKKVIMVLGSNIGNLLHPKAIEFLTRLKDIMHDRDRLFMGFDQKKDPQVILDAYNDDDGITAAFNKNLLKRINRELGGNFELEKFKHWEVYDPETGTAKSYLVATRAMTVRVEALELDVTFDPWETIHTEISQKYTDKIVSWLASKSGLEVEAAYTDSKDYYKNYVFKKSK